jgi:curved DNA-binding protein CbpA
MENKLIILKGDFNNVIIIRTNIQNIFDVLQVRINKLKLFYSDFIKNSKNQMFVFGLDSFQFQSKLIDIEYDDMKRLFGAINNRMYCEYYKLNKIIIEYILNSVDDKKYTDSINSSIFPIYKDLEPFKEYDFNITLDIHQNILNMIGLLTTILSTKENELASHKMKQNIGLNINNFITTFTFNNTILREKISMFISYVVFFHSLHTKYLKRFSTKIQLMHTHIDTDVKFDEAVEINKETKKGLLEDLNTGNIDKTLLHDLRKSISVKSDLLNDEETSESEISESEIQGIVKRLPETLSYNKDTSFDNIFNRVLLSNSEPELNDVSNSIINIDSFVVNNENDYTNTVKYNSKNLTTQENISSYIETATISISDEQPILGNQNLDIVEQYKSISEEEISTISSDNVIIDEDINKKKTKARKKNNKNI